MPSALATELGGLGSLELKAPLFTTGFDQQPFEPLGLTENVPPGMSEKAAGKRRMAEPPLPSPRSHLGELGICLVPLVDG